MKKLTCLLLAILLTLSLAACGQEPPEKTHRVKTITYEGYDLEGSLIYTTHTEYTYDETGDLLTLTTSQDGQVTETRTYTRDDYGNELSLTKTAPDGTETVEAYTLTLDEEHRVTRQESSAGISENTYDEEGRIKVLRITRNVPNLGEVISTTTMTYDAEGNVIRQDVDWHGSGQNTYVLSEYSDGKHMQDVQYAEDGALLQKQTYSYDDTGLVATVLMENAEGVATSKSICTYDEYGNLLSQAQYLGGLNKSGDFPNHPSMVTTYTYEPVE